MRETLRSNNVLKAANWLTTRPFFLFLFWAFWLASTYLIFGQSSFVKIFDNGDSILPAMLGLKHVFAFPPFAYWNPLWIAGADLLSQGMITDIDSLPFAVLPGWLAYGTTIYLQRLVAAYFTFRLLREYLELDILPATFGALTYSIFIQPLAGDALGFSLYDHFTLPALPFVLWALSRTSQTRGPLMYSLAAGIGLLYSLISTYIFAVFLIPLVLYWLLFLTPGAKSRVYLMLPVFLGAWLLGELPALWANWLNGGESHRVYFVPSNLEVGLGYLLEQVSVVRNLIGDNIVATGLLVLGIISVGANDRRLVKLTVALFLSICLVLLLPLVRILVLGTGLQFLAGFTFERVLILVPFLVVTCGAVGVQMIKNSRTLVVAGALGFTVLMFTVIPVVKFLVGATSDNSLISEFTIGRLLSLLPFLAIALGAVGVYSIERATHLNLLRLSSRFFAVPLSTLLVAGAIFSVGWDSLQVNMSNLSRMERGHRFGSLYSDPGISSLVNDTDSPEPFRVVTITDSFRFGILHPAYAWAYGLESADGYINMFPKRYKDYWASIVAPINTIEPRQFNNFLRTNRTYLYPPVDGFNPSKTVNFSTYYDLELLSLANVRYVLSPLPIDDDRLSLYSSQRNGEGVYIYENQSVLPRFFLVGQSLVYRDQAQLLEEMGAANTAQLQSTAYLSQSDVDQFLLSKLDGQGGAIRIVSYSTDQIVLDVQSFGTNWLIASNSYSPYWTAFVDGKEESVFPVYHTFQGVYLESGQHEVILRYRPPYSGYFRFRSSP